MNDVCRARASSPSNVEGRVLGEDLPVRPEPDPGAGHALADPGALAGQPGLRGERRRRAVAVEDAGDAAVEGHAPGWPGERSTSTSIRAESALTTEAPTPCRPPVATYEPPPNLPPGVQLGEDHLDAGQPGLRLLVDRDAAAVVVHLDGAVGVQGDLDAVRRAGQRLVDAVVDDLPDAVHEPAGVGRADVHARALAHRLEALEDQQVCCVVRVVDRSVASSEMPGKPPVSNLPVRAPAVGDGAPKPRLPCRRSYRGAHGHRHDVGTIRLGTGDNATGTGVQASHWQRPRRRRTVRSVPRLEVLGFGVRLPRAWMGVSGITRTRGNQSPPVATLSQTTPMKRRGRSDYCSCP